MGNEEPDSTAVRVALWRALHLLHDDPPPIFEDEIGLKLAAPEENWRQRPDMQPEGTGGFRAGIVARARFIEDMVLERAKSGLEQYVVLGAGLETFAQRRLQEAPRLRVFEIDQPATQAWKKRRLSETGLGIPSRLNFVPVDFEAGESWREKLPASGFDPKLSAFLASAGLSPYLTREANEATLREAALLAPGSTFVMTFLLPMHLIPEGERTFLKMIYDRARAVGTPFLSFFEPQEILSLATKAGFTKVEHISRSEILDLYFKGRSDDLAPASGEEYLVATL